MNIQAINNISINRNNTSKTSIAFKGNTFSTIVNPGEKIYTRDSKLISLTQPKEMIEYKRYPWECHIPQKFFNTKEILKLMLGERTPMVSSCANPPVTFLAGSFLNHDTWDFYRSSEPWFIESRNRWIRDLHEDHFDGVRSSIPRGGYSDPWVKGPGVMTLDEAYVDLANKMEKFRPTIKQYFDEQIENSKSIDKKLVHNAKEVPAFASAAEFGAVCKRQATKYLENYDHFIKTDLLPRAEFFRQMRLTQDKLKQVNSKLAEILPLLAKHGIHL